MTNSYKPEGYNSVSPYLLVSDAKKTIAFLVEVFDAVPLRSHADDTGRLMHGEVRIEDTVIMLADATDEWKMIPSYVHIYVRDVDAIYQKALAAGAFSAQEPVQKGDEDKRGGVKDPWGTTWWIATRVGKA